MGNEALERWRALSPAQMMRVVAIIQEARAAALRAQALVRSKVYVQRERPGCSFEEEAVAMGAALDLLNSLSGGS